MQREKKGVQEMLVRGSYEVIMPFLIEGSCNWKGGYNYVSNG